jgi:hypothetical protein
VKAEERGRLHDNRRTDQPSRADKERTHASDDAIREAEVRCPLSGSIENQQLLFEKHGFGDHRTGAARTGKSGDGHQQVKNEDGQVAHWTILPRRYSGKCS